MANSLKQNDTATNWPSSCVFYDMEILLLWLKFYWTFCVQSTASHINSSNGLAAPNRWQAVVWTDYDIVARTRWKERRSQCRWYMTHYYHLAGCYCKIVTSSGTFKCVFAQECANPISGLGRSVVAMVAGAIRNTTLWLHWTLIARFMGPTWGPSGAGRTDVGPMNFVIWWGISGAHLLLQRAVGVELTPSSS